ncbi:conserved hypothetical protein [Verrucomicrobiia bacterium DG1235]|nr:conserved hypothetical protein [Verrucomicrobiae bacterium DG1235]
MKSFSGKQIHKAGNDLQSFDTLSKEEFNKVMDVLSFWRFCHEEPLNSALASLRATVFKRDKNAFFAKRLKRYVSIYKKLNRFPQMSLRNMQDIGGCRAVIESDKKLKQSVRDLKKLPYFKTEAGNYRTKDYIKNPKKDGYRSYHLVGRFPTSNGEYRNIELQLRTRIQHYWATALEIVDLFTGQALKSNQGSPDWSDFFIQISHQFSLMDSIHLFEHSTPREKRVKYITALRKSKSSHKSHIATQVLAKKLKVERKLNAFANSVEIIEKRLNDSPNLGYALLKVDTGKKLVKSVFFDKDSSGEAEQRYIEAEKEAALTTELVVALVSSNAIGGIKEAYPNYFADSTEFLSHLNLITSVNI